MVFNPDPGFGNAPSWTGASQGLIPDTGAATAIKGLTTLTEGVAATADYGIQQNIRKDVNDIFSVTNAASGLDEQVGYATAPNATSIPPELKGTKDAFARFVQARDAGKISDSHYWSLLTTSMKEMKAKYPGYGEQIDNIYQDVTGHKPAVALRNSLMQDYNQMQSQQASQQNKTEQHLWDMREEIQQTHPGFFANREAYAGKEGEVLSDALKVSSQRQAEQAEVTKLNLLSNQKKLTNEMASESYAKTVESTVQRNLDSKMNELVGGQEFSSLLEATTKGPPDPQTLETLNAHLNALEANTRMDINRLSSEDYVLNIPPQDRQAIENKALERIGFIKQLLTDKDTGSAFYYARLNKTVEDRNLNIVRDKIPGMAEVMATPPELRQSWLVMNKGGSDLIQKLVPGFLTSTFGGSQSVNSIMDGINGEKSLSGAEKANVATGYIQKIEQTFADRALDDQHVVNFVESNFAKDNPDASQIMSKIAPEDRWKVYKTLTSPVIIDRIAKTGNKDAINFYTSWARSAFDDIPNVTTALANISADLGRYSLAIDGKSHQVMAVPSEGTLKNAQKEASLSQTGTIGLGRVPGFNEMPSDPNVFVKRDIDRANKTLTPINTSLTNLMYLFQKAGMNPDEEFINLMKEHGINVQQQGDSKNVEPPLKEGSLGTGGDGRIDVLSSEGVQPAAFNDLSPKVISWLKDDFNLTTEQAAGVVGNLGHESNGFQTLQEVSPTAGRGGYGWAQWTGPRRKEYEEWANANGLDTTTPEANYGFLKHELQGKESGVLDKLRAAADRYDAAKIFAQDFERPGIVNLKSREKYADLALSAYGPE